MRQWLVQWLAIQKIRTARCRKKEQYRQVFCVFYLCHFLPIVEGVKTMNYSPAILSNELNFLVGINTFRTPHLRPP